MTATVKFSMSVVLVGKSLKVAIPRQLAAYLGLQKGDRVSMWADDTCIMVEKQAVQKLQVLEKEKDTS